MKKIGIFGLGRVGLPLALSFAEENHQVIGVDIDKNKLGNLEKGLMPFLEQDGGPLLKKHINKNFEVTTNTDYALQNSEYLILTLGTPVDEHLNPDFSQINSVLKKCAPMVKKDHTFILRSTVSPGTTEYVARFLENQTTLKVGKDIYLAFCPERIAEGKAIQEIKELPQIIGALDDNSKEKAKELFYDLSSEVLLTDVRSAELSKLFCNMHRYINFAIGNEFMMIAEEKGCDIYEIGRLVNHNYKRGGLSSPGLSAGPCLYKDGFFLIDNTPFSELITTSWRINEGTPRYLIKKIKEKKEIKNEKVALLGLSFKKDVDDTRNSLSYKAKKIFLAEGAEVYSHDPFIKSDSLEYVLDNSGIVFVAINHSHYKNLNLSYLKHHVNQDCLVADIWNIFDTGKTLFELKNYDKK